MQTLVIGHKNPDMDAICSAIAYAEFKTSTGAENVRPARCGNTNERIDFALRKFGYEAPLFVTSVRPRVEDVMERNVIFAGNDDPVYDALTRIGEKRFRGLPVVNRDLRCIGLISSFKISQYLFPPKNKVESAREVHASLKNIIETIDGRLLAGPSETDTRHFVLVVAAMQTDSFQRRLDLLDHEKPSSSSATGGTFSKSRSRPASMPSSSPATCPFTPPSSLSPMSTASASLPRPTTRPPPCS